MTSAASSRIRRRIRYAQFDMASENRVQKGSLNRERMSCSEQLRSGTYQNTQDWASGVGVSPSGRFKVIEEALPKKRLISSEGIRWDLARTLLIVCGGLMLAILLAELASIGASSVQIRKLEEKIEAVQLKNKNLEANLAVSAGDISVCTEAIKLNMISSSGAKTITLTAPQDASMLLIQTGPDTSEENPEVRASASSY